MAWAYMIAAGLLEVVFAFSMKQSAGFTRIGFAISTVVAMLFSIYLLSLSMRSLPLGTAYTVWTGIGAIGSLIVGIVVYGEPAGMLRLLAASLILSGLVLMKLASPH